jgi:NTP pyrophosphatase (non-canonical NTP hydrolase)
MDLTHLQSAHQVWLYHNFPHQTPHQALLGVAEEVGELCHAHLKYEQAIRGITEEEYTKLASDAIGDIVIYLCSYCNTNHFDLDKCVMDAWDEVKKRDWKMAPLDGELG